MEIHNVSLFGVITLDEDQNIKMMNEAAKKNGYENRDILGNS